MLANPSCALALVPLLLLGSRPDPVTELRVEDAATWARRAGGGAAAPRIAAPVPGERGGRRFVFAGEARRGYAELPLDGDRLQADGFHAVRLEYRTSGGDAPDLVLVTAAGGYRSPLPDTGGEWKTHRAEIADFAPFSGVSLPTAARAPRRLRVEAPDGGLSSDVTLDVRSLWLECDPSSAAPWPAARTAPPAAKEGLLRGPFLLGANRSLLDPLGEAGGNAVVEYTATWPRIHVEDHLDYARAAGVDVFAAVSGERDGRAIDADARLAPLANHPALAGWYLSDEPDGARFRGLPAADFAPGSLEARARALSPVPTLITCLDPFGLQPYARSATILSTDHYLPAFDAEAPLTIVHSDAEAVVETAAAGGAVPAIVLQLAHDDWPNVQDPASLRAQAMAALAGGVRGVLVFQGAAAVRAAERGGAGADLWDAFLSLCGELAAVAPAAERWTRVPGEPTLGGVTGDVRASCFVLDGARWIVVVNLAREARPVRLAGACLDGARRLVDPAGAWSADVRDGAWSGSLAPLEAHVLRVEGDARGAAAAPRAVLRLPARTDLPVRFDRALVGGTLFPAPDGAVRLVVDGVDRTADARIARGAGTVVRLMARDLAAGEHRVELTWEHAGSASRDEWTFAVEAPRRAPIRDAFDRDTLGADWGVIRDAVWNHHDPEETAPAGRAEIRDGALHVASTGGGLGVRLLRFEAPPSFTMEVTVRRDAPGAILLERADVYQRLELPAGTSRVTLRERPGERAFLVDGVERARWSPPAEHRGGGIGLGVPHGGRAAFDDFALTVP